jgi:hypothetical protein
MAGKKNSLPARMLFTSDFTPRNTLLLVVAFFIGLL